MPKNAIIIPTYNERNNIPVLLKKIFDLIPESWILIVDDNSPDGTAEAVGKLQKQYSNLFLLRRSQKDGLGRAYVAGFRNILEQPDFQTITMMDGDLSHDPRFLPSMLKLAETYDLIIGSRYVPGGGVTKHWEIWRRFLSLAGNWYLRILFGRYPIHDWTSGYNIIRTSALKKINLDLLNPRGYAFISSLKYYLAKSGTKIIESPILFEERNGGESKMSSSIIKEGLIAPWKIIIREFFQ